MTLQKQNFYFFEKKILITNETVLNTRLDSS